MGGGPDDGLALLAEHCNVAAVQQWLLPSRGSLLQDEAAELTGGITRGGSAEKGLALLAEHCAIAAVTLGERGCLAQRRGEAPFAEPAVKDVRVADATGDLPAASFLGA